MAPARKSSLLKAALCLVALVLSASIAPSLAHADNVMPALKHSGRGLLQDDSDVVENNLDNLQLPDEDVMSPEEGPLEAETPLADSVAPSVEEEDTGADPPVAAVSVSSSSSVSVGSVADAPATVVAEAEGPAAEGPGAEGLDGDELAISEFDDDFAITPESEVESIVESSASMATMGVVALGLLSSAMLGLLF